MCCEYYDVIICDFGDDRRTNKIKIIMSAINLGVIKKWSCESFNVKNKNSQIQRSVLIGAEVVKTCLILRFNVYLSVLDQ